MDFTNIGNIHTTRRASGQIVSVGLAAAQLPSGTWTVVKARFDASDRSLTIDGRATGRTWATEAEADRWAMDETN